MQNSTYNMKKKPEADVYTDGETRKADGKKNPRLMSILLEKKTNRD